MIAADVGYPPAAEWLRRTIVPTLRRLPDAAGWMAFRAGAAVFGEREGLAAVVGMAEIGRDVRLRVAMYSPSGQPVSKAICFLFREGENEPSLVVKAMAEPRFDWRLRTESTVLESIRKRVSHDRHVTGALPPEPLFAGAAGGEFVVTEPFDAVSVATGSGDRNHAVEWLRAFQAASCSHTQLWAVEDEHAVLTATQEAWRLADLDGDAVTRSLRRLLVPLRGLTLPRCSVHGDFWRGNIASRDGRLRVYDWEWSELDGIPLFDLWTYELAELRMRVNAGWRALDEPLRVALENVRSELASRRLDERFALATLPPVLAELAFRIRRRLGMYDGLEKPSIALMAACQRLLLPR